jgi:carboxyl-terminal processing protease
MRSLIWLPLTISLSLGFSTAAHSQTGGTSPNAAAYLRGALDTLEAVTLGRDSTPWRAIRDSAFLLAEGARKPSDTYGAIAWALHRANKHSFLQASQPGAVMELVDGRYGYIHVPQRGGDGGTLADSLHLDIEMLESGGACGWIVDLRGNGGGNMWPMLAGIGPLLGDTVVGSFGIGGNADRWYYRHGVSGILHPNGKLAKVSQVTMTPIKLRRPDAPVAILIDGGTASSGEAVAVAFQGRHNSRTFGSPTAGFMTANRGSGLPDGANMVVTTGYYADRRGKLYTEPVQPDSLVTGSPQGWPFATDRVSTAARHWLANQPGCRHFSRAVRHQGFTGGGDAGSTDSPGFGMTS